MDIRQTGENEDRGDFRRRGTRGYNAPGNVIGKESAPIEQGQWQRVLIEVHNDEVAVQLNNGQLIRGQCNLASTPKRSPSISYQGDGVDGVSFDNFKIWAVK